MYILHTKEIRETTIIKDLQDRIKKKYRNIYEYGIK